MKSYTTKQWEAIDDWVEAHLVLIRVCGLEIAEGIAQRSPSGFSERLREDCWSPLAGVSPSRVHLAESFKRVEWQRSEIETETKELRWKSTASTLADLSMAKSRKGKSRPPMAMLSIACFTTNT